MTDTAAVESSLIEKDCRSDRALGFLARWLQGGMKPVRT